MKKLMMLVLCLCVAGVSQAAVIWDGGGADGLWHTATNWNTDAVPLGSEDASITGVAVSYVPGGDLNRSSGSILTLDGASLTQTTTHWSTYGTGSSFTLINGAHLDFVNAKIQVKANATGPVTTTIDGSTLTAKSFLADDFITIDVTNGSTLNLHQAAGWEVELQNGSVLNLVDSTMTVSKLYLNAYGGNSSTLNVAGQLNIMNGASLGAGVISKAADSMVNLQAGGLVFIDGITVVNLETMIGEGKFGIGGIGSTTLTDYTYGVSGSGVTIVPEPATMVLLGLGGLGLIRRKK